MPTRVAVNGFGGVGRAVLRIAHERGPELEVVAINDPAWRPSRRCCTRRSAS